MRGYVNKFLIILFFAGILNSISAQENVAKPYDPNRGANKQIDSALAIAKKENKHVLLQIGGNWCSWCMMLHKFYSSEASIDSILKKEYVIAYINYSKENKNPGILKKLEYPQRFGFPVLVILNADGQRLHTQNTAYLEEGKGYSKEKVLSFLNDWKPSALKSDSYKLE